MAMGRHRRWRGAGRRGGRHPWGVAGRFDAGVVAERGTGAAQHGDCPERGAISRTESTRREDRINRLRRAVVCLCVYESGGRLHGLENTVDGKKWVAGGDSQGLLNDHFGFEFFLNLIYSAQMEILFFEFLSAKKHLKNLQCLRLLIFTKPSL